LESKGARQREGRQREQQKQTIWKGQEHRKPWPVLANADDTARADLMQATGHAKPGARREKPGSKYV
jgi:hypothetical protein